MTDATPPAHYALEPRRQSANMPLSMNLWKFAASVCLGALLSGCTTVSTEQQINYGLNHYRMGLYGHAIPPLMSAAESLDHTTPADPRLVDVLIALGEMAQGTKRNDLAAGFLPRAVKVAESLEPQDAARLRNSLVHLGNFYLAERPADAVPLLARAEEISRTMGDQVLHAIDQDNLAQAYQATKDYRLASALGLRALDTLSRATTGKLLTRTKGVILHNLGYTYMEMGRLEEAEARFKESLIVLRSAPAEVESWRINTVTNSYAKLLRRTGRVQEANEFEKQSKADAQ